MIPSIETIVEGLADGTYTKSQAVSWLYQHAEGVATDLRDHFAAQQLVAFRAHPANEAKANLSHVADYCYAMADAMLAKRAA